MRKLHLVGLTTDRDGLIFTARKGSKSGGFIVPLDDKVLAAIAEARQAGNGAPAEGPGAVAEVPKRLRSQSALTPREMQSRLRAGRSIEEVAAEAGVDNEWVARFAVPILAEQAQVIELARSLVYAKPRLGESSESLGASVIQNLADRGVFIPDDVADAGWTAFQLHDSVWMVRFRYRSRGRDQEAQWEVDVPAGRLLARNRQASDLGYVDPDRRRRDVEADEEGVDDVPPAPRRPRPQTAKRAPARPPKPRAKAAPAVKAAPVKRQTRARATSKVQATRAAPARPAKTTKAGKTPAKATAKSPTRRRPAKAGPAPEVGPAAGSGGVRMAVAKVSTARVAASLANADRAPWAAAVRRPARPAAAAVPPPSPRGGATRAASSSPRRPRPGVVERGREDREQQSGGVPPFQPRPLPAGGERSVESRVRKVTVPRSTRSTDEAPAVSLPAPRPASSRQEALPLERSKRRRLRAR